MILMPFHFFFNACFIDKILAVEKMLNHTERRLDTINEQMKRLAIGVESEELASGAVVRKSSHRPNNKVKRVSSLKVQSKKPALDAVKPFAATRPDF